MLLIHSLHIIEEDEMMENKVSHSFYGNAHYSSDYHPTSTTKIIYSNPFREYDLSSFPEDLLQQLNRFPILQQIAILKDPQLQQKYFPEYCK